LREAEVWNNSRCVLYSLARYLLGDLVLLQTCHVSKSVFLEMGKKTDHTNVYEITAHEIALYSSSRSSSRRPYNAQILFYFSLMFLCCVVH